ncbi:hypothetical protein INS49_004241 [Diaporthe citri]|uniref:uncharacterized protein n=1 Tax=Diaporthe citri TaxID=83186 RepID=UPI001C813CE1|nr:uncharacterized protein INS49_004241 [Diaporthe citri]KAG6355160.1 hypothetical protein INS49_004241 [Diaporthe citri]
MEPLSSASTDAGSAPISVAETSSYAEAGLELASAAITPINDTSGASPSKPLTIQDDEPHETTKDVPLSNKHITGVAVLFLLGTIAFAVSSGLVKSNEATLAPSYSDLFDPGCTDKLGDSGSPAITQAFNLDLTFGNFTFTHAKILDVAWDTTIGQGALCWVLDGSRFDSTDDHIEIGPDFSSLGTVTTAYNYTKTKPCLNVLSTEYPEASYFHTRRLVYTSGGWKLDKTTTIWDHFNTINGSNNIEQSSENFQSIRAYAITKQLLQISLDPQGWVTNGSEVALTAEVVEWSGISFDWWAGTDGTCSFRNLTSSRPILRPSIDAALVVSPQSTPVPADLKFALEFDVPENMSKAHFSLGNVSGESLPPGQMPYNSTLWLNGTAISLAAPFIDVGHGCSGNNGFGSLGNCICYKGQPISLDLLGEGRAICNTAPGYVWGFSSSLLRLGLGFEAAWMACCLICYLWLSVRGGLVNKKIMRSAGPMQFALEFSEAVCEIEETAAELSEDMLKARLKDINDPPVFNLSESGPPPGPYVMSWDDVKALLKAGLNPRFCSDKQTAVDLLTHGGLVDCLSFMGGFSHVVFMAGFSKDGAILEKKHIDRGIELAVDKYVFERTKENWEALSVAVDKGTTKDGKPFTNEQRAAIAKIIQRELVKFFGPPSLGKDDVWLAFVKAFDMVAYDVGGYGGFGKSGSKRLHSNDFFQTIMYSFGQNKSPDVPEKLVWGFVKLARDYGATLGW